MDLTLHFHFWATLILIACAFGAIMTTCAYLILLERKISAWAQDRLGPNRVGPGGIWQPIADGLKFLFKEEVVHTYVDKLFYMMAPAIAISTEVWPAETTATVGDAMRPRTVSTPATAPSAPRFIPVTSQFWMMSTP